jgi:uncharacterized protein (TIRG00374 family)
MNAQAKTPAQTRLGFRRIIPGLILGFIVIIGLALLADLRMVSLTMLDFSWWVFPLALLCATVSFFFRFLRWHFYLHQIGVSKIGWLLSLRLFMAGFPLSVTPVNVGELMKGVWLNQKTGIPVGRGISVVVAERITDGIAILFLSLVGVAIYPQFWPAFVAVLTIVLGLVVILQVRPAALGVLGWLEKFPSLQGFVNGLREFYEGSYSLLLPGPLLAAVVLGLLAWGGMGMAFYMVLFGLGYTPTFSLAAFAIFLVSLATMVGAATTLPGGLGAMEASLAGLLCFSVDATPAMAAAATLLFRLVTLWYSVGLGILVWTMSKDLLGLQAEHDIIVAG